MFSTDIPNPAYFSTDPGYSCTDVELSTKGNSYTKIEMRKVNAIAPK